MSVDVTLMKLADDIEDVFIFQDADYLLFWLTHETGNRIDIDGGTQKINIHVVSKLLVKAKEVIAREKALSDAFEHVEEWVWTETDWDWARETLERCVEPLEKVLMDYQRGIVTAVFVDFWY